MQSLSIYLQGNPHHTNYRAVEQNLRLVMCHLFEMNVLGMN